jgi:iron(III) transport system ATP-binding protein
MHLSGGQQQRVAVARGLVGGPDVLLMDEPFSNLDAKLRDLMRVELKELQRRLGTSILFVTHDQTEALALSDRIAVMKSGQVEQIGAPLDLYMNPQTSFVRDFLGQTLQMKADIQCLSEDGSVQVVLANDQILLVSGQNHLITKRNSGPCLVTIRPEEIGIGDKSSSQSTNHVSARIRTLLFLGQHFEALVDFEGGDSCLIHLPRLSGWQEGQTLSIHLPAEFLQIWDRD